MEPSCCINLLTAIIGQRAKQADMPYSPISILDPAALDALMDHLPVGLIIASAENLEIVAASQQAADVLRRSRDELEGKRIADIIRDFVLISPGGEVAQVFETPVTRACKSGEVVRGEEWSVDDGSGRLAVFLVNAAPIRGEDGRVVGGLASWTDITVLKATEQGLRECVANEALLLREANHRIKNLFQLVASLVKMEARRPGITAGELAASVEDRLSVLAAAHEGVCLSTHRGSVDAAQLLEQVALALDSSRHPILASKAPNLEFHEFQVTPVALALNEAISNALKHAFPDDQPGRILISVERDAEGMIVLEIADEGTGLPEQGIKPGLGVQILEAFARQLNGTFTLENRSGGGAVVRLRFPQAPS